MKYLCTVQGPEKVFFLSAYKKSTGEGHYSTNSRNIRLLSEPERDKWLACARAMGLHAESQEVPE